MLLIEDGGQRLNNRRRSRIFFSTELPEGTDSGVACHRGLAVGGEITQQGDSALVLQVGQAAKHTIPNGLVPGTGPLDGLLGDVKIQGQRNVDNVTRTI